MKYSIIPIFIPHLGCPHNCVFCNQRKIAGTLKSPTPYEVRALIEKGLLVSGHPAEIAFYGGSFTAIDTKLQESYLDTAYTFIKTGLVSNVRLSTRPDCIDDKTILRLKKYGVTTVELGAQSMDDGILKLSGRGHTKKDIIEASRKIKNSGMKLILQMMCGLPGDTREKD
ncbi:MAG: radical SAM protein, partial [Clostridiales bacterium]|nr:radical SAM protein [Clostridiales bacterium]